jgi:hypothetical protein
MRHKIAVLFLVLTLLLNLAACGNSSSTLTDAGTTDIGTDTSDGTDEWTATDAGTMKQVCKGASFQHEKAIQFDFTGGDRMVTSQKELDKWLTSLK